MSLYADAFMSRHLLTVAYVLGSAPQPTSPFTYDEIAQIDQWMRVRRTGVIDSGIQQTGWVTSGPKFNIAGLPSFLRQFGQHPRAVIAVLALLVRTSITKPGDLIVGIRSIIGACVLHERVSRPDVIHAQFAGPAAAAAHMWSQLANVPWTVRAHAYDIYTPYRWAPAILAEASMVFAISQHGRRHLEMEFGVPSELLHVGIPVDAIGHRGPAQPTRPLRLLTVGALVAKKGHERALEAVAHLAGTGFDVELDIVGEGPLRRHLEECARLVKAPVRWLGALPSESVRQAYSAYDAFLFTPEVTGEGDMDGIPVVIMEAMAAGLPVLSGVTGGIAEIVIDGTTGTVLPEDVDGIAVGIRSAVADYPRLLRMARLAQALVAQRFNVLTTTRQLVDVWVSLGNSTAFRE